MCSKAVLLVWAILLSSFSLWAQGISGKIELTSSWRPDRTTTLLLEDTRSLVTIQDNMQDRQLVYIDAADQARYILHTDQQPARAFRFEHNGMDGRSNSLGLSNIQIQPDTKTISGLQAHKVTFLMQGNQGEVWVTNDLVDWQLDQHLSSASGEFGQYLTVPGVSGVALAWELPAVAGSPARTVSMTVESYTSAPTAVALPTNVRVLDMTEIAQLQQTAQTDPAQAQAIQAQIESLKAAFYQN